jgi:hypothetical protein
VKGVAVGKSVGIRLGVAVGRDASEVAITSSIRIPGVGVALGRQAVTINNNNIDKMRKRMRRLYTLHGHKSSVALGEAQHITEMQCFSDHYSTGMRLSPEGANMRRVLSVIAVVLWLLPACAPAGPAATRDPSYPSEPSYPGEDIAFPDAPPGLTPAELGVIHQLAAKLGLQESDISVVSREETEFGDACLGVAMEGVVCAQVTIPGRILVLEANEIQFEYHISEDGTRVQPATLALIWKREGGIAGFCDSLTIFRSGEVIANNCSSQGQIRMRTFADLLTSSQKQEFNSWLSEFGKVELDVSDPEGVADRMIVTVELFGLGSKTPTESEQQDMINFAQDLYQEVIP